jgi:hypothetical protein
MNFHFPLMPRLFMALQMREPDPDRRHPRADPDACPRELPVGDVPAQPRRAHPRDGHRRGTRLHGAGLRRRPPRCASTSASGAGWPRCSATTAARSSCSTRCCSRCRAPRSSTTATRSAWATTSTSATATACAPRCSGAPTATPGSRPPTRTALFLPLITEPGYHYENVNVEAQLATRARCCRGCASSSRCASATRARSRRDRVPRPRQPHVLAFVRRLDGPSGTRSCASPTCRGWRSTSSSTCATFIRASCPSRCSARPGSRRSASPRLPRHPAPYGFFWLSLEGGASPTRAARPARLAGQMDRGPAPTSGARPGARTTGCRTVGGTPARCHDPFASVHRGHVRRSRGRSSRC